MDVLENRGHLITTCAAEAELGRYVTAFLSLQPLSMNIVLFLSFLGRSVECKKGIWSISTC
jgi:hypothetical protein